MKTSFQFAVTLATAAMLAATFMATSQAQDYQGLASAIFAPSNQPATVSATSASATTNVIVLRKGQGLGINWLFNLGGSGTSVGQLVIRPSVDGTNYPQAATWILAGTASGTNLIDVNTNWTPLQLAGYATFSIQFTNANASVLTNLGVIVNRPN